MCFETTYRVYERHAWFYVSFDWRRFLSNDHGKINVPFFLAVVFWKERSSCDFVSSLAVSFLATSGVPRDERNLWLWNNLKFFFFFFFFYKSLQIETCKVTPCWLWWMILLQLVRTYCVAWFVVIYFEKLKLKHVLCSSGLNLNFDLFSKRLEVKGRRTTTTTTLCRT